MYCEEWMKPVLIGQENGLELRNDHARSFILYFPPDRRFLVAPKYAVNHANRGMDETCCKWKVTVSRLLKSQCQKFYPVLSPCQKPIMTRLACRGNLFMYYEEWVKPFWIGQGMDEIIFNRSGEWTGTQKWSCQKIKLVHCPRQKVYRGPKIHI